jgi:hypothetical protein
MSWQYADPADRFDAARFEVHPIPTELARPYVQQNHYLGGDSYPSEKLRYGLFRQDRLVGVAVYATPTSNLVLTKALPDLTPNYESTVLARFVLDDSCPGNSESFFLARTFAYLRAAGMRGVVTFADPQFGHCGIIYQASGAHYTGRTKPAVQHHLSDGSILNKRTLSKAKKAGESGEAYAMRRLISLGASPPRPGQDRKEWVEEALRATGAEKRTAPGKHRYVFALARNRKERQQIRIGYTSYPYPKMPLTGGG